MTEFLFSIIELEGVLVYRQFIYFMKNHRLCLSRLLNYLESQMHFLITVEMHQTLENNC